MVAPLISIEKIVKHYGTLKVLDDVSLTIDEGEFIALLGPSGCGKTTLLRTIAGFAEVTSGRILLGGQDITRLPPNRRPVNTVFQNYALFPHMTVADNVAYGPRRTGSRGAELRRIVDEAIATVGMDQMAGRYPSQLSGGQQQRVALARAIANRPRVLLLDEPLGALDLKLRKQMQIELKTLQRKLGMTFIFVTHDQEEALVLADRIAVMDAGRIAQLGTGEEIYHAPSEEYVADFIGDANLIRCVVDKDGVARSTEGDLVLGKAARPPGAGVALLRPEAVAIAAAGQEPQSFQRTVEAVVTSIIFVGHAVRVGAQIVNGPQVVAQHPSGPGRVPFVVGQQVRLGLDDSAVTVLRS